MNKKSFLESAHFLNESYPRIWLISLLNVALINFFFIASLVKQGSDDFPLEGVLWLFLQILFMLAAGIGTIKIAFIRSVPAHAKLLLFLMLGFPVFLTIIAIMVSEMIG